MNVYPLVLFLLLLSYNLMAKPKETVIATVNGRNILQQDFQQSYLQNKMFVGNEIITKRKVLNDLIRRELGVERAKKNKIDSDPEVQKKIEDILYHAQLSRDLESRFKKIKVTEKELKKYYSLHPEYRTAHILLRVRVKPSVKEVEAALKQINKIYDEVNKDPSKFEQLANRYSQIGTAPAGGDIGFQPAVKLAPKYFQAINGKKPGYITPPIRTQFGYHIIKVLAVKQFGDIDKRVYNKIVYDTKRDKIIDNYFVELKKNASIKINEKLLQ